MSFQIKNFAAIVASMIAQAKANQSQLTDFTVGSVARTLMEAPAVEIDQLYQEMFAGIMDAIPVSVYQAFGYVARGAVPARGYVTVTFGGPLVAPTDILPAGAVFASASTGAQYLTQSDTIAAAGATSVSILVVAATPGAASNTSAGDVSVLQGYQLPDGSVISSGLISGGSDAETPDELKARFGEFIAALSSGTVDAIKYAAINTTITTPSGAVLEYVSRVGIEEQPGVVSLYLWGVNGPPSADLVTKVQAALDGYVDQNGAAIPGYRAGGIQAIALPMAAVPVDVSLIVGMLPDYTYSLATYNAIVSAISPIISAVPSGGVLIMSAISEAALSVAGVQSAIVGNTSNVPCGQNQVLQLGTLTVSNA